LLKDSTRALASDTAAAARPLEVTPSASTGLLSAGDAGHLEAVAGASLAEDRAVHAQTARLNSFD